MRLIPIPILLFISLSLSAQYNYKDTLRIVRSGDSHCSGAGAQNIDSSWGSRFKAYLETKYGTVIESILCTGGETTRTFMPAWSYQSNSTKNVDTALNFNPDFVVMEYSGNDFVVQYMNTIETLNNLRFLHDTLEKRGVKCAMTGMAPRQKTFGGPVTQQGYKDTALKLNLALAAAYHDHYLGIWYPLLRADSTGKVAPGYLSADSLHFNDGGHGVFWESMMQYPGMDVIACNCKGMAVNFSLSKVGDSLRIYSKEIVAARIEIYGSNDQSTFTYITDWRMPVGEFDHKINGTDYTYYQVRILSGFRPTIVRTEKIN